MCLEEILFTNLISGNKFKRAFFCQTASEMERGVLKRVKSLYILIKKQD